jgi:hypothetical protein
MTGDLVIEENGCFAFCHVFSDGTGKWRASVQFERVSDHEVLETMIPGVRHKLRHAHASEDEALAAALEYAITTAREGKTGL